jgi:hypothetical protein
MPKLVKPMAAESYPLGHAKENKDASAYTGFQYPPGGGDDIGKYKQPMPNPNGNMESAIVKSGSDVDSLNPSAGLVGKRNYKPVKTDGVTMRGYGAATKGIKSRGPMA